jgi:RNA polymerase sigma factor (sigma-70 family)
MSNPNSFELLERLLAGQGDAAKAIFERYVDRLLALARARMSSKLRRRVDPDDVVQSAYRSFFLHAQHREYRLDQSGDLWRLLACITLNKLHGQIEKQTAAKRSLNREAGEGIARAELAAQEPTVADVIAVAEQFTVIVKGLAAEERVVLSMSLEGHPPGEIAKSISRSERTVRRLLAQARAEFEKRLLDDRGSRAYRHNSKASVSVDSLAPLRFSDYVLQKLLGAGGMGKVYRATDKRSGRTVAIKALHKARQHDERAVERFVQESQILGKLRHTNIVGVEGLGRFPGGGYFLVMDYIDGADLQSRLTSGPLPVQQAVSILKHVASAVQHAHDHGVIHCDLKPANVLVGRGERVWVTDFGFACILNDTTTENPPGIGGTAGYMAPEMWSQAFEPGPAADVYALGAMLWTLVTGAIPFCRDEVRTENDDVKPLAKFCCRCLADRPEERFRSISDLRDALNELPIR